MLRRFTRLLQFGGTVLAQQAPRRRLMTLSTRYSLSRLAFAVNKPAAPFPLRHLSTVPDQPYDQQTLDTLAATAESRHLHEEGIITRGTLETRLFRHNGNAEKVRQELAGLIKLLETEEGSRLAAIHGHFIYARFFFHDGDSFKTLVEIREALSLLAMPSARKLTSSEMVSAYYLVDLYQQCQGNAYPVSLEIGHLIGLYHDLDAQFLFTAKVIKPKDMLTRMRRRGESTDEIKIHLEHLAKIYHSPEVEKLLAAKVIQPGYLRERFIANDLDYEKTRAELAQLAELVALQPAKDLVTAKVLRPSQLIEILQRNGRDLKKAKSELTKLTWVASSEYATLLLALKVIEPGDLAQRFHWHKELPGALLGELYNLDQLNSQASARELISQGIITPRYLAEVLYSHNGNYDQACAALADLRQFCESAEVQTLSLKTRQSLAQGFRRSNWDIEATRKQIDFLPKDAPLAQSSRFVGHVVEVKAGGVQIISVPSLAPRPGKHSS